jgi:hypothetical protein
MKDEIMDLGIWDFGTAEIRDGIRLETRCLRKLKTNFEMSPSGISVPPECEDGIRCE